MLEGWEQWPKTWFERCIHHLFAALPAHPWEDPAIFLTGAVREVNRLMQSRGQTPLIPVQGDAVYKVGVTNLPIRASDIDIIDLHVGVNLGCKNRELACVFLKLVDQARKSRGYEIRAHRPASLPAIKRDYVVYVLRREEWTIPEIDVQLKTMGCIPLPPRKDPKASVRRIVGRYRSIEEAIVRGTPNWRTKALLNKQ